MEDGKLVNKKPLVALTLGDPAGVGPEITVKLLGGRWIHGVCRPLVIGDLCAVKRAMEQTGIRLRIHLTDDPAGGIYEDGTLNLMDQGCLTDADYPMGAVDSRCGDAAFCYVKKAVELALEKKVDANVTAPLNKESMNLAGHAFSGHTEIYAHYTKVKDYAMLLAYGGMRVAHISTHVSLRQACGLVKKERILKVIDLSVQTLKQLGIDRPRIAVAGLNPHCGEGGLFGTEELEEIIPAVKEAAMRGLDVCGPVPPDTVFCKLKGGQYDLCICMYHDQGHIPVKLAGFVWEKGETQGAVNGINMTLGLPVIRVSVDHGTGFDIAGKNLASEASLAEAVEYAVKMVRSGPGSL